MRRELRADQGRPFVTDSGNYLLHCAVGPIAAPRELLRDIREIPGIVEAGLFLGAADIVIVEDGDRVDMLARETAAAPAAGGEGTLRHRVG